VARFEGFLDIIFGVFVSLSHVKHACSMYNDLQKGWDYIEVH